MPDSRAASTQTLTGWGRNTTSTATQVHATSEDELADLIAGATQTSLVPRGLGRSYGDAATNASGTVIAPFRPSDPISLAADRTTVPATAATTIDRRLQELLRRGRTPPGLPGTGHASLAGRM